MPSQTSSCSFRRGNCGGAEFRLLYRGRAVTGWRPAATGVPVCAVGDVLVVQALPGGLPAPLCLPSSFCGALVPAAPGPLLRMGRAAFLSAPRLPALLEYANGRSAFCCRAPGGELVFSCAGSPAAAAGAHHRLVAALPAPIRRAFRAASGDFRLRFAQDAVRGGAVSVAAQKALARLRAAGRAVHARGETGEYAVWAFAETGGGFSVAGVASRATTLTLLLPFLPPGRAWSADWLDDAQDYYAKDGLAIRPETVSRETRAVVKTAERGGFLLRLCLKR